MFHIQTPLSSDKIKNLKAGDEILLSGTIYIARDQAHKKLKNVLLNKKKLPFFLQEQIIYYCGPTPTPLGKIIGSCGPTTSSRMDRFTPLLLKKGLKGIIGKGRRGKDVIRAIKKHNAIYFVAFGGCGALLSTFVKKKKLVAYPNLGAEAIYCLEVEDFPLIVGVDGQGRSIFKREKNDKKK